VIGYVNSAPKTGSPPGFPEKISEPGMNPSLVEENKQSSIEFDENQGLILSKREQLALHSQWFSDGVIFLHFQCNCWSK